MFTENLYFNVLSTTLPGDLFLDGVFFPFLLSFRVGVLLFDSTLLLQLWFAEIDSFCNDWLQELKFTFEWFLNEVLSGLMFSLLDFFAQR